MSHTSQRRGLKPENPGEEIIVLAMIPKEYRQKKGITDSMKTLAELITKNKPHLWISHNFIDLDIPQLGSKQGLVRLLNRIRPEATRDLIFKTVAEKSSVLTAIYTNMDSVFNLLDDLNGDWVENNRKEGHPISIVLSGLFDDVHKCCERAKLKEHTYLHSLGFKGKADKLPKADQLELVTMCGHGLISIHRVQHMIKEIKSGFMTPKQAAENIAGPCVCGIVNIDRAEKIFQHIVKV